VGKSWGRGSSAVAEWDPPSSSATHTDQYEVFKAGGQKNETFTAAPWKEVSYNLPPQIIEYNKNTKEYRYHVEKKIRINKPAHRAFPERAA